MTTIFGIDVHPHFQAGLSIERVRAEGFDFMAVKMSEATATYPGQDWLRRGMACGLLSIGYHYLRPGNEQAQARVFADQLAQVGVPGMLDAEALAGDSHTATLNVTGIHRFLDCAAACGAKVPLMYLPRWYWQRMGSPDLSGLPPLWASSYVSSGGYAAALYENVTPSAWAAYGGLPVAVLQFTDKALVAGQRVDADAFQGTRDQFANLINRSVITPRVPGQVNNGGNEMAWRLVATPVKSGNKVGDHPDGSWPAFEDTITVRAGDMAVMAVWGYAGAWIQEAWFGPSGTHIVDPKHPVYVSQFDAQVWAVPAGTRFLVIRYASPAGGSVGPV